jgi:hypothetical protein
MVQGGFDSLLRCNLLMFNLIRIIMKYTKSLCYDKLDLIKGMIEGCALNAVEIEEIWERLNGVSHDIDEFIDRNGVRDRKEVVK